MRKEAKKSGIKRKAKKELDVPNSAPFKEEVLREAEQRKQEVLLTDRTLFLPVFCTANKISFKSAAQLEELKEKNKLAKQKERAEKRKKGKEAAAADDGPKAKRARKVAEGEDLGFKIMHVAVGICL